MPWNEYHFTDTWDIPAPCEAVWDLLARPVDYPRWWDCFRKCVALDGDEPRLGARAQITARGWLPYTLRYTVKTTALERPRLIQFDVTGDFFVEGGKWVLTPSKSGGTQATLEWNPRVEKPVVKQLSPLFKPLFQSNHRYMMGRGQRQIAAYLKAPGVRTGRA